MNLTALSNDELVSSLKAAIAEGHRVVARIVAHLAEIEERRLHLEAACPSMFDFCVRRLGMSEPSASRKVAAARLLRRFPIVFDLLASGRIHISTLLLLRDHLTEENHAELLEACAGKSTREVEKLLAARAPKPDVPSTITKLPSDAPRPTLVTSASAPADPPAPSPKPTSPARFAPLSEDRYKVQFTASAELARKLERAVALMRHRNPSGDLAVVAEAALDALLVKLEKERLGKTTRPRKSSRPSSRPATGEVPTAVRREVFERDGEQCGFIDESGDRCPERGFLEIDHRTPRAKGGLGVTENLRVLCWAHNRYVAEKEFGREHVEAQIARRRRTSTPKDRSPRERERASGDPKGTPSAETAAPFDLACRGLVNLGFREVESRRALETVRERHESGTPSVEVLVREALGVLT